MLRKKLKLSPEKDYSNDSEEVSITTKPTTSFDNSNGNNINESKYFKKTTTFPEKFLEITQKLNISLSNLEFSNPVYYVYNPTIYAIDMYAKYIKKYCNTSKDILFVGLNPGPNGMCQTGIPFGNVDTVKNWLKVSEDTTPVILKPKKECPERLVIGLECTKNEVSGKRFWEFFQSLCGTPDNFFKNAFLYNYCPLQIMKENGSNITPGDLTKENKEQRDELVKHCNVALEDILDLLQVNIVIAIGTYARDKVNKVLKNCNNTNVKVLYLVHPSPLVRSKNSWSQTAAEFIEEYQLTKYFTPEENTKNTKY